MVAQWQQDGRAIFLFEQRQIPARMFRLSMNGDRELVKTLAPDDRAGAIAIHRLVMTRTADAYAYTLERQLSDVYVATGFRQPPLVARVPLLRLLLSASANGVSAERSQSGR
jgi:hypothetical protein